jgi:hypothetical protein
MEDFKNNIGNWPVFNIEKEKKADKILQKNFLKNIKKSESKKNRNVTKNSIDDSCPENELSISEILKETSKQYIQMKNKDDNDKNIMSKLDYIIKAMDSEFSDNIDMSYAAGFMIKKDIEDSAFIFDYDDNINVVNEKNITQDVIRNKKMHQMISRVLARNNNEKIKTTKERSDEEINMRCIPVCTREYEEKQLKAKSLVEENDCIMGNNCFCYQHFGFIMKAFVLLKKYNSSNSNNEHKYDGNNKKFKWTGSQGEYEKEEKEEFDVRFDDDDDDDDNNNNNNNNNLKDASFFHKSTTKEKEKEKEKEEEEEEEQNIDNGLCLYCIRENFTIHHTASLVMNIPANNSFSMVHHRIYLNIPGEYPCNRCTTSSQVSVDPQIINSKLLYKMVTRNGTKWLLQEGIPVIDSEKNPYAISQDFRMGVLQ